jgi:amino acid transporter
MTVGIVVGAGIFRTPSLVASAADSVGMVLVSWAAGGLISLVGALCYAELACAYPQAGGDYQYLSRAFGKDLAFLYAWARLAVIQTGSIALLAFVFGDYASQLLPLGPISAEIYAAGTVAGVSFLQWCGLKAGTRTQNWLTGLELAGLGVVIVAGLVIAPAAAAAPAAAGPPGPGGLGLAMVFVLLTFGGWNEAVYFSAELKNARRRMAPVMISSLLLITVLYLAVNAAYLRALGLAGTAASEAVATDVMKLAFGATGGTLISLFVAVAALTSVNGTVFTGARSAFAWGGDHAALSWLGRWHDRAATPRNALLAQAGGALALVLVGGLAREGFKTAVEYTAPVFWAFLLLVGLALFRLRRLEPHVERPFRAPLYPVLPAMFVATNAYLLYSSLAYTGRGALLGVAVVAAGGLLLSVLRIRTQKEAPS